MTSTKRRRGKVLEDAILDATWVTLRRVGYAALSIEAVAAEASTSKPVIYRRWPTRLELVLAAVLHRAPLEELIEPDTGSLRGDLRAVVSQMSDRLTALSAAAPGLVAEFPGNPQIIDEIRSEFGSPAARVQAIADRAAARGEIPTADLPRRTLMAPLQLVRYELLMTMRPIDAATLDGIVDDVALPLYGATTPGKDRR